MSVWMCVRVHIGGTFKNWVLLVMSYRMPSLASTSATWFCSLNTCIILESPNICIKYLQSSIIFTYIKVHLKKLLTFNFVLTIKLFLMLSRNFLTFIFQINYHVQNWQCDKIVESSSYLTKDTCFSANH